jgi:hypothetical protein
MLEAAPERRESQPVLNCGSLRTLSKGTLIGDVVLSPDEALGHSDPVDDRRYLRPLRRQRPTARDGFREGSPPDQVDDGEA